MSLLRAAALVALVAACAACGSDDDTVDAAPPMPVARTVSFTWTVTDLNDVELACDRIDAQLVTVTFFQVRTGQGFSEVFDCFRKAGTRSLDEGEYMVGFELADRFGTLATLPARRYQVAADMALDPVAFRLDPFGGLVFTLDTGLPASCGGSSTITGMTIALSHADGTCEPATLAIEPATSYTVSCASPAVTGCIEKGQRVTVSHVPADEYRIRVTALQSASTCWVYDQPQRVRAAGLVRTLVLPMSKTCN